MDILKFSKSESASIAKKTAHVLLRGELVVLPTDTVYGVMAIATDEAAVAKLYAAKKRDLKKPSAVLVYTLGTATDYLGNGSVTKLGQRFWPGPLTIVKESTKKIGGCSKIGVRIPDDDFLLKVLAQVEKPVMATSANISGEPAPINLDSVSSKVLEKTSLAVDKGRTALAEESTVVELSDSAPNILREGPISLKQIKKVLADG